MPPLTCLAAWLLPLLLAAARAVADVVNRYDYHATLLHLFGLDHRRLAGARNGQH
jgi:hypothetical protein